MKHLRLLAVLVLAGCSGISDRDRYDHGDYLDPEGVLAEIDLSASSSWARHEVLLEALANLAEGRPAGIDPRAAQQMGDIEQLPGYGSNNFVNMAFGVRTDGRLLPDVRQVMRWYRDVGIDWDEGNSPVYLSWSVMGRIAALERLPEGTAKDELGALVKLDAWMLSLTMADGWKGPVSFGAGQRAALGNENGMWSDELARWLVLGIPAPPPGREPTDRWSRTYHERRWLKAHPRPAVGLPAHPADASQQIKGKVEPWTGRGFYRSERLTEDALRWVAARFLEEAKGWRWRSGFVFLRWADGDIGSYMLSYGGGGNTSPAPAVLWRSRPLRSNVCYVWPWRPMRSVRGRAIQASSIDRGIRIEGGEYSLTLRDGRSDSCTFPPGERLRIELGPSGAAAWVDGRPVQ